MAAYDGSNLFPNGQQYRPPTVDGLGQSFGALDLNRSSSLTSSKPPVLSLPALESTNSFFDVNAIISGSSQTGEKPPASTSPLPLPPLSASAEIPVPPNPAATGPIDLDQLAVQKEKGAISQAEYEAAELELVLKQSAAEAERAAREAQMLEEAEIQAALESSANEYGFQGGSSSMVTAKEIMSGGSAGGAGGSSVGRADDSVYVVGVGAVVASSSSGGALSYRPSTVLRNQTTQPSSSSSSSGSSYSSLSSSSSAAAHPSPSSIPTPEITSHYSAPKPASRSPLPATHGSTLATSDLFEARAASTNRMLEMQREGSAAGNVSLPPSIPHPTPAGMNSYGAGSYSPDVSHEAEYASAEAPPLMAPRRQGSVVSLIERRRRDIMAAVTAGKTLSFEDAAFLREQLFEQQDQRAEPENSTTPTAPIPVVPKEEQPQAPPVPLARSASLSFQSNATRHLLKQKQQTPSPLGQQKAVSPPLSEPSVYTAPKTVSPTTTSFQPPPAEISMFPSTSPTNAQTDNDYAIASFQQQQMQQELMQEHLKKEQQVLLQHLQYKEQQQKEQREKEQKEREEREREVQQQNSSASPDQPIVGRRVAPADYQLLPPSTTSPYASLRNPTGASFVRDALTANSPNSFSVISNNPITLSTVSDNMCYFEVTILSIPAEQKGKDAVIAIGLATTPFPDSKPPGWSPISVSFLSTGERAHCTATIEGLTPEEVDAISTASRSSFSKIGFGAGDTIGCGYMPSVGSVFFTLNGAFIGEAFSLLGEDVPNDPANASDVTFPFHACAGGSDLSIDIDFNFGPNFLYALSSSEFGAGSATEESWEAATIEPSPNAPVASAPAPSSLVSSPSFGSDASLPSSAQYQLQSFLAAGVPTAAVSTTAATQSSYSTQDYSLNNMSFDAAPVAVVRGPAAGPGKINLFGRKNQAQQQGPDGALSPPPNPAKLNLNWLKKKPKSTSERDRPGSRGGGSLAAIGQRATTPKVDQPLTMMDDLFMSSGGAPRPPKNNKNATKLGNVGMQSSNGSEMLYQQVGTTSSGSVTSLGGGMASPNAGMKPPPMPMPMQAMPAMPNMYAMAPIPPASRSSSKFNPLTTPTSPNIGSIPTPEPGFHQYPSASFVHVHGTVSQNLMDPSFENHHVTPHAPVITHATSTTAPQQYVPVRGYAMPQQQPLPSPPLPSVMGVVSGPMNPDMGYTGVPPHLRAATGLGGNPPLMVSSSMGGFPSASVSPAAMAAGGNMFGTEQMFGYAQHNAMGVAAVPQIQQHQAPTEPAAPLPAWASKLPTLDALADEPDDDDDIVQFPVTVAGTGGGIAPAPTPAPNGFVMR
ncbi:hypothetical protein HDU97_003552 [Phlyctochytrium planicorne]|nr:hypothetical protein HDU97_003552 [Phlyctochytrium planicorne]